MDRRHGGGRLAWSASQRRSALLGALLATGFAGCGDGPGDAESAHQAATARVVVPVINATLKARLRTIYLNGQALGNRAAVFSKVGDSLTVSTSYLADIGCSREVVGTNTELSPTISYFRSTAFTGRTTASTCTVANSFSLTSYAAGTNWTTTNVLAATTRSGCASPYNTNLKCELRQTRPSIALIMLGTRDLQNSASTTTYSNELTRIVTDTIAAGVIPVLSTIPPRTDTTNNANRVTSYNNAVLAVAAAQQVPVWDYWLAMTDPSMINQGLSTDKITPSVYSAGSANFTAAGLAYGYNQRNYTAVQVLEHIRAIVIADGPPDVDPTVDGGVDGSVDATPDVIDAAADVVDAAADVAVDTTVDATVDVVDAAVDAAVDVAVDATVDTALDATIDVVDAAVDATVDTAVDATVDAGTTRSVIPVVNAALKARLRAVYANGLALGNRAAVFSKVGDGITATTNFLTAIGCGTETLGLHTELAAPISYFRATSLPGRSTASCGISNSFTADSIAAAPTWTTQSVLGPVTRADCPAPYNTMLTCELRLTRPSMSLVMIGTNDLEQINDLANYTTNLTRIVTDTINAGVIPVLSTLSPRTDNATLGARIAAYNDAVLSVAAAQQVPVWDYWLAMTDPSMINQGLSDNGLHPSVYNTSDSANFNTAALAYGYNQRNYTAVQALEHIKAVVIDDGAPDPGGTTDAGLDAATDVVDATTDIVDATLDTVDAAADIVDVTTDTVDVATDVVDAATDIVDASGDACVSAQLVDPTLAATLAAQRQSCAFGPGARVADTLGVTAAVRSRIPVDHVIVLTQENRSFDHYFGAQPGDVDRIPSTYTNPDNSGNNVRPAERLNACEAYDLPHQWDAMHSGWNNGAMDGFVRTCLAAGVPPSTSMAYYTSRILPFYSWLYGHFAMSDRYFGGVLGGTWANRDFLYMASSYGVRDTNTTAITNKPTIFTALTSAGVTWGVYTDGDVRQDSIGWSNTHAGVANSAAFFSQLAAGTLPSVVFLDPGPTQDEHPPANPQVGEAWSRTIVSSLMASPLWSRTALIITYDESGGYFDHVPPPSVCYPHPPATAGYDTTDLNRDGIRIPMVVVSPWSRAGYVSHVNHDHASTVRFIETLFDIPALTGRDANAAALLDLFDFSCAQSASLAGALPASGTGGCP